MNEKDKILLYTSNKFITEGYIKTTIGDLASDLGIGKNKIYKYFPTKQILLLGATKYFVNNIKKNVSSIFEKQNSAIEKLINMLNLISSHIMNVNEKFLKDMQTHNPEVWQVIDNMRKKLAFVTLSKLIEQGKREKIFINYPNEILVTVFIGAFRAVINPEFLLNNRFTLKEAFGYTHKFLINAILSDKGKVLLKKLNLSQ